ncbi:hypothetical protein AArcCO_2355 [Halalkaliarchaeum sp. AArc-CO]|uniref:hypothetical protein n=1 Tax=unclassified Halalkaliarchaeum TaxID=2678344 RepID=UPI00217F1064|nr:MULTISPECIES: hypothetical protein [unclassified Halalkaliarchaeum]MDR5672141.1 hypothetical protein [Halalkaliarchaeum sp. AArc-GB]UWG51646.1 hypothetical protein AArcCO_2355 [Halalkaliarchaeum sp. AArc-CO]
MSGATIEFRFESPADERLFLREYLAPAWPRFQTSESWETGWYWAYGQFAPYDSGPDGGLVRLVFEGSPDELVDAEAGRWTGFEGLVGWELTRYDEEGYDSLLEQQRDAKGDVGGEWDYRLKPLVSEFSLSYLRAFDEPLPVVGDRNEDNPVGFGLWAVIHYAMIQCGHDWYDETRACQMALKNRLQSIAAYRGADAARTEYDRLLKEWRDHREELTQWLEDNPTGETTLE